MSANAWPRSLVFDDLDEFVRREGGGVLPGGPDYMVGMNVDPGANPPTPSHGNTGNSRGICRQERRQGRRIKKDF